MFRKNVATKEFIIRFQEKGTDQKMREIKISAESAESAKLSVLDLYQEIEILEVLDEHHRPLQERE